MKILVTPPIATAEALPPVLAADRPFLNREDHLSLNRNMPGILIAHA